MESESASVEAREEMGLHFGAPAYTTDYKIETKLSINPHYLMLYNQISRIDGEPMNKDKDNTKMPDLNRYFGIFSDKAKSRLKKALNWLIHISLPKVMKYKGKSFRFKLTFVTLELPGAQIHPDWDIAKLLHQLLSELEQNYNLLYYIWKAEKQKNGSVHYHLTTDAFIPHEDLRARWCRIINKLGYVDRYKAAQIEWHKKGFKAHPESFWKKNKDGSFKLDADGKQIAHWSLEAQKKAYYAQMSLPEAERWMLPNCTDIHSVKGVKNLVAYLVEYFAKNGLTDDEEKEIKTIQDRIHTNKFDLKRLNEFLLTREEVIDDTRERIKKLQVERSKKIAQIKEIRYGAIAMSKAKNKKTEIQEKISELVVEQNSLEWEIQNCEVTLNNALNEAEHVAKKEMLEGFVQSDWNELVDKFGSKIVFGDLWSSSRNLGNIRLNVNCSQNSEVSAEVGSLIKDEEIETSETGPYGKVVKAGIERVKKRGRYPKIGEAFDDKITELRSYKKIVKPKEIAAYFDSETARYSWFLNMTPKIHEASKDLIFCALDSGLCYRYVAQSLESGSFQRSFESLKIDGHNIFTFSTDEYREVMSKKVCAA